MSWTDTYPLLDEDHLADFESHATTAERAELEDWCPVARKIGERPARDALDSGAAGKMI